jgi:hypothetical protein
VTWTRITSPEQAEGQLPVWFGTRMLGLRGRFGLVLTTGDVLRITCITALHESPHGVILLAMCCWTMPGCPTVSIRPGR